MKHGYKNRSAFPLKTKFKLVKVSIKANFKNNLVELDMYT